MAKARNAKLGLVAAVVLIVACLSVLVIQDIASARSDSAVGNSVPTASAAK